MFSSGANKVSKQALALLLALSQNLYCHRLGKRPVFLLLSSVPSVTHCTSRFVRARPLTRGYQSNITALRVIFGFYCKNEHIAASACLASYNKVHAIYAVDGINNVTNPCRFVDTQMKWERNQGAVTTTSTNATYKKI